MTLPPFRAMRNECPPIFSAINQKVLLSAIGSFVELFS